MLIGFAVALGCWWGGSWLMQRRMLFPRELAFAPPDPPGSLDAVERLWVDTPEGQVEAWFIPGAGVSRERPGPAVLFAHGNAELIQGSAAGLRHYRESGISVLLGEYRGYGKSAGSPSQAKITEDFRRFYAILAARAEVDRERIIFHGRSLGGGVLCALARHAPPRALILQSTFHSVTRMAAGYGLPPFLVRDPFDNAAVVAGLDCPILIFHGNRDRVVPFRHGVALSRLAQNGTFVEYDCDHNDFPPDEQRFWHDVDAFLARHALQGSLAPPGSP